MTQQYCNEDELYITEIRYILMMINGECFEACFCNIFITFPKKANLGINLQNKKKLFFFCGKKETCFALYFSSKKYFEQTFSML